MKRKLSDARSDAELVEICNRGDGDAAVAAFSSLYLRHKDFVLRVALRLTADRELRQNARRLPLSPR